MFLAYVISVCEDYLICDLAEYYGIYDYESMPVKLIATLTMGLRPESRVMMKLTDSKTTTDRILMAQMLDRLNFISWSKTRDGQKNRNRPASVTDRILGRDPEQRFEKPRAFNSSDEFERWLKRKRKEWNHG